MNRENSHRISVGRNFSFTHLSLTSSREKTSFIGDSKTKGRHFFFCARGRRNAQIEKVGKRSTTDIVQDWPHTKRKKNEMMIGKRY
jgi:hypothetical protein